MKTIQAMTVKTNHDPKLYQEVLRHGHWQSFLEYAWPQTDCAKLTGCTNSCRLDKQNKPKRRSRTIVSF